MLRRAVRRAAGSFDFRWDRHGLWPHREALRGRACRGCSRHHVHWEGPHRCLTFNPLLRTMGSTWNMEGVLQGGSRSIAYLCNSLWGYIIQRSTCWPTSKQTFFRAKPQTKHLCRRWLLYLGRSPSVREGESRSKRLRWATATDAWADLYGEPLGMFHRRCQHPTAFGWALAFARQKHWGDGDLICSLQKTRQDL